jgi:hypothetical protein
MRTMRRCSRHGPIMILQTLDILQRMRLSTGEHNFCQRGAVSVTLHEVILRLGIEAVNFRSGHHTRIRLRLYNVRETYGYWPSRLCTICLTFGAFNGTMTVVLTVVIWAIRSYEVIFNLIIYIHIRTQSPKMSRIAVRARHKCCLTSIRFLIVSGFKLERRKDIVSRPPEKMR